MLAGEVIGVLVAEDDAAMREALIEFIESLPDMEVVGWAGTADAAVEAAIRLAPDVVLLDIRMPGDPQDATSVMSSASASARVIVLTATSEFQVLTKMLRAGAWGYILKGVEPRQIAEAIRLVMRGEMVLARDLTAQVIRELIRQMERSENLAREVATFNQTKDEILQILSHEILTPVTVVQAAVGALAKHGSRMSEERMKAVIESVENAGFRLKRVVGNVQTLTRLPAQGPVDARMVAVEQVIEGALRAFSKDRARIEVTACPPNAVLLVDPELAVRALEVVLENCLALSPAGSPIAITSHQLQGSAEIRIRDQAPSIPADRREDVFAPFVQLDTGETRGHGGLGLGLTVAQLIMEAHSGRIWVEEAPGGGNLFVLTFPTPSSKSGVP